MQANRLPRLHDVAVETLIHCALHPIAAPSVRHLECFGELCEWGGLEKRRTEEHESLVVSQPLPRRSEAVAGLRAQACGVRRSTATVILCQRTRSGNDLDGQAAAGLDDLRAETLC